MWAARNNSAEVDSEEDTVSSEQGKENHQKIGLGSGGEISRPQLYQQKLDGQFYNHVILDIVIYVSSLGEYASNW